MKIVTEQVVTETKKIVFQENDIALDGAWFAVGIRRGRRWYFTPSAPRYKNEIKVFTDEEVEKGIKNRSFMYIGNYSDLWDTAGAQSRADGLYDILKGV